LIRRREEETKQEIKPLRLDQLIAKTVPDKGDGTGGIQDLFTHCVLTGTVAREIVTRLPEKIKKALFPDGIDFLAAVHDTGKAYPAFQAKIYRAAIEKEALAQGQYPPELEGINPDHDKANGYHWSVSRAALLQINKQAAEIAGRHHGVQPMTMLSATAERYGGTAWQNVREQLVSLLHDIFSTPWPNIPDFSHALPIAGLVSVSDWIASSILSPASIEPGEIKKLTGEIEASVDRAGFIVPRIKKGLSFSDVFHGYSPRPLQKKFYELIDKPGVYCLEAEMGAGKTEAALYAAYTLLERGHSGGIYFALPTRLTSEKIYDRFDEFLSNILEDGSGYTSPILLHGKSWMKWSEIGEAEDAGSEWFQSKRRAILAPFGVGTIDQALMAVMNVKYGFVRAFGLTGKVVILDEVHSYDSYTGTLLDKLIETLCTLGSTVIILSATLTGNRRNVILGNSIEQKISEAAREPYPLISTDTGDRKTSPVVESEKKEVAIHIVSEKKSCIEESLRRAEEGQQVLWIENSVGEAQNVYRILSGRSIGMAIEVGLLHSRFTAFDRAAIEKRWVSLFGKEAGSNRYHTGRILVGTQVLEQSLDIDADFMISRIAPSDMLIQRIGRLWRHHSNNSSRPSTSKREIYILMPASYQIADKPKDAFGVSAYIYSPYVLARSAELWGEKKSLILPNDIRGIIEDTYCEREEGKLAILKNALIKERDKLSSLAALGLVQEGISLPEGAAATRYSDRETVELLLLKNISYQREAVSLTLLNGKHLDIPRQKKKGSKAMRREYAIALQENILQVAKVHAPDYFSSKELSWLAPYLYLGDEKYSPLRVSLVSDSSSLIWNGRDDINSSYELTYRNTIGYEAKKRTT
jgi:CRISPR-associated endonuclease/helicase Cas3